MSVQKKSNRRQFIGNLGTLSLGFPIAAHAQTTRLLSPDCDEHQHGFVILPYLESLTPTSCCITMITKLKSSPDFRPVHFEEAQKKKLNVVVGLQRGYQTNVDRTIDPLIKHLLKT